MATVTNKETNNDLHVKNKCVNNYCDNDAEKSPSASIANCDGDLVCSASCMRAYERQRYHYSKSFFRLDE